MPLAMPRPQMPLSLRYTSVVSLFGLLFVLNSYRHYLTGDLSFDEVKAVIDDYMSYYNSERYQWDLAKLSPNEYFSFVTTGIYPLDLPSKPSPPEIPKTPNELGAHALEQETVFDSLIR